MIKPEQINLEALPIEQIINDQLERYEQKTRDLEAWK